MKPELVDILRCPQIGSRLELTDARSSGTEVMEGNLRTPDGSYSYSVRGGIPRFAPASNYADSFGLQWNHFSRTQMDSHSGRPISAERFWAVTGWTPEMIKGQWVLDVGCGSGRFAEVALSAGAKVVAVDYSSAVDACAANLGQYEHLHVVQGDMCCLPFAPGTFSFIYCVGVIQHTPDFRRAFAGLIPMLAADGHLCVDYYEKSWRNLLAPKEYLRPFTKRMEKKRLFSCIQSTLPTLLLISNVVGKIPFAGKYLKGLVPVANYTDILPLSDQQIKEWALLDTFDWLSPEYDNPQTPKFVREIMEAAKLVDIEVLKAGHLVGRGRRSSERTAAKHCAEYQKSRLQIRG